MAAEIKPLTSIRGVAAILVTVYHFYQLNDVGNAALNRLVRHGYFWVDLFFVLSGFVMALTYANAFAGGYRWQAHQQFLLKRIARIYPLYLAVTLGVSIYSLVIYGGYGEVHRPAIHLDNPLLAHFTNVLMINAWGFGASIGGATWSISAEWAAYLLFPFLVYLALFAKRAGAALLALAAVMVLIYVATHEEAHQSVRNGQLDLYHCVDLKAVGRCFAGFSIGLLAFRFTRWQAVMRIVALDSICMGLFVGLLALMASGLPDLYIYPVLPLLVLSLYAAKGWAARAFSCAPLYTLGVGSYSIYLLHANFHVVFDQLNLRLPNYLPSTLAMWAASLTTYAVILIAALITYHFIEKPGRSLLSKLAQAKNTKDIKAPNLSLAE